MTKETLPNPLGQPSGNFNQDLAESLYVALSERQADETKARLKAVWKRWKAVQDDPELLSLFDRQASLASDKSPHDLLAEHDYPERSKIEDLDLGERGVHIDNKFIKDGFVYLMRGDNPGQADKGFYSRTYGYAGKNTQQLSEDIHTAQEVGYALYQQDTYLRRDPERKTVADQLAYFQSARGGSSFVSTTTSIESARAGTGNQPTPEEQSKGEVYILKIPLDSVIDSGTGNFFGMEEDEYLVPDYVGVDEVVAHFPRDDKEGIYQYLHDQLGIEKADIRF